MRGSPRESSQPAVIFGLACVVFGLFLNPWIIARTLSPDGILDKGTTIAVLLFDGLFLLAGVVFLVLRRRFNPARCVGYLARRWPNLTASAFGLALCLALLALVEHGFYYVNARAKDPEVYYYSNGDLHGYDPYLGYKPFPDHESMVTLTWNGERVSSVTYTFDRYGRRVVPGGEPDAARTKSILVFGCSFVQGSGVENDETLPAQIAAEAPSYAVYNYGYGGYGTQHMLAQLEKPALPEELEAPADIALYVFIPAHIRRCYGSMTVMNRWGSYFPCYGVHGDSVLREGNFREAQPWRLWWFRVLGHEQIMKRYNMDVPLRITDAQVRYTAALIVAARNRFKDRFGSDRFQVVIWPRHPRDETPGTRIIPFLQAEGVHVLNYWDAPEAGDPRFLIPHDLHPAAFAHESIARRICEDIALSAGSAGGGDPAQ
ncbi:MAG: hypothetical protein IT364_09750 [Candidatus Hydrogenedentes bacterium]|nr:hypothetical protein [Candidatus Hydrogenedentota bacterium]